MSPPTAHSISQCCRSGSGAFLTPGSGSGIGFFWIPDLDPGSLPHIFQNLLTILVKKFYNSLKIGPNFFLQQFKTENLQFCEICGYIKSYDNKIFFHPSLLLLFLIRDPGWLKSGSGIWDKHPGSAMLLYAVLIAL